MAEPTGAGQRNAHAAPPSVLRDVYKYYQKIEPESVDREPDIVDFVRGITDEHWATIHHDGDVSAEVIVSSCGTVIDETSTIIQDLKDRPRYRSSTIPGLYIYPSLLPPTAQLALLSRLLHRDLSNPQHKTNVHLHYDIRYPHNAAHYAEEVNPIYREQGMSATKPTIARPSFFTQDPTTPDICQRKPPSGPQSLSAAAFLAKKLRWMTLGYQYDWTQKVYPDETPPPFPPDLVHLLQGLFPEMSPQAAIVNLYSPGDTLGLHRDVSEQCHRGLISASLGCDALFVAGLEQPDGRPTYMVLRLRSGDVVYMTGAARLARNATRTW
ncbi:MAG: hypothetical protein M1838_003918 [Thelocarpon superellum]|nr:MAG: hypothetical protein M1838_003918 [Thelocarpon superellum]